MSACRCTCHAAPVEDALAAAEVDIPDLTVRDAALLAALLPVGRWWSRERLGFRVWGDCIGPNTVSMQVHRTRKRLVGTDWRIATNATRGYRLERVG